MDCLYCPICEREKQALDLYSENKVYSSYCSRHLLEAIRNVRTSMNNTKFRYKVYDNCFFGRSTELIALYAEIRKRKFNGEQILAQTS